MAGFDFVRRDDQAGIGDLLATSKPCRQEMLFVGWPRRAGDEGWPRRAKRLYKGGWRLLGTGPNLIVASVAGNCHVIALHAQLAQPLGVGFVDCTNAIDSAVRVSEQSSGKWSTPSRAFGKSRADHADLHTPVSGRLGESGPDIELAENESIWLQRRDDLFSMIEAIERQVVGEIGFH